VAALHGDNVVEPSGRMPWYEGPTLLGFLEELEVASDRNLDELRFPVQWVTGDVYAGQVASGVVQPGDEVTVLPGSRRSRVAAIVTKDGELGEAFPPLSVALRLEDGLRVSRGDMIAAAGLEPVEARSLEATVCWMHERPLAAGDRFLLKHTTRTVGAEVAVVVGRLDVRTADEEATGELRLNDIGRVRLELDEPVFCDPYERNRTTGSFILIEASTGDTAGAGMVV
jgi:bifunctional enzyme CysN/CysC